MKNTLLRRASAGTFAAVAAIGLSTLFATAASAHSVGPHGSADCGSDGKYTITWTVENDYNTKVTLSDVKVGGSAAANAPATLGAKGSATAKGSFTTKHAGDTKGDVVLSGGARWQDGNKLWPADGPLPFGTKVYLKGDCKPPTTPPSSPAPSSPAPSTSTPRTPEASRSSSPSLPVTGSSSTMPLVGTGAALVAGGAVLIVTLRRRRKVTFTA